MNKAHCYSILLFTMSSFKVYDSKVALHLIMMKTFIKRLDQQHKSEQAVATLNTRF